MVTMSHKFGEILSRWFGCSQDILQGHSHLNASLELKGPLSRWLPPVVDTLVLAFGEKITSRGLIE